MNKLTRAVTRLGTVFFSVVSTLAFSSSFVTKEKEIPVANKVASIEEKLEIYTLSLNNYGHGDCSIVKFGNTEVLIDAGGSIDKSKERIYNALKRIVKDNVIEYAIMSHGDGDHIANFLPGGGLAEWLSEGENYINVFIDFDISADTSIKNYPNRKQVVNFKDSKGLLKYNYEVPRETLKNLKRIRHHLVSSMCVIDHRELSRSDIETFKEYARFGNKKYVTDTFYLDYEPNNPSFISNPKEDVFTTKDTGCSLKILYNYYYDHPISKDSSRAIASVDHNVISVCSLITLNTKSGDPIKALFTGDLEEYDSSRAYRKIPAEGSQIIGGESLLYEYNKDVLNTPITYYKAAHHCSDTSNSPTFLEKIRPVNVVVSACADGEHGLPGADLSHGSSRLDNSSLGELSYYTDHIYITDKLEIDDKGNKTAVPYYGDIHFTAQSNGNNDIEFLNPPKSIDEEVKPIEIPKSAFFTDWMREKRFYSLRVFNLTNSANVAVNCTYIKIGSIDILIGAGAESSNGNLYINELAKKVDYLCNDHVIDYLIIPSPNQADWLFLLGKNRYGTYVLQNTDIKSVKNFIYYYSTSINDKENKDYIGFIDRVNKSSVASNMESYTPITLKENIKIGNQKKYGMYLDFDGLYHDEYYLEFLTHNGAIITDNGIPTDKSTASLYTLLRCGSYQYLNLGSDYNCGYYSEGNYLLENNPEIKNAIHLLQYPNFGYYPEKIDVDNLPIARFHAETNATKGGIGDEATNIGGKVFLNTLFGEKSESQCKHPTLASEILKKNMQQTVYTTKGCGKQAIAICGDMYQRVSLQQDKIFLYRVKKSGSLTYDGFSFYNNKASCRSDVGKNNSAETIESDDVKNYG